MTISIRWSFINITLNNSVMWNIIKNLFVPIWYKDKVIDIQLIPIIAIIVLLVLL
jgi:hypothetical protein